MTSAVIRSKIIFFDSNPIGRIVTRYSKDMMMLDLQVPAQGMFFIMGSLRFISVAITVAALNLWLVIPIVITTLLLVLVMKRGAASMVESQRIDSISRTPINSTLAMVINGLVSLRVQEK
jgi:ATP-binding cassette, subfamily C (CFTR/MRP), member 4